jgi:predicted nucleic acid-binding protein
VGIIRGRYRVRLPDAIHLATARHAGASAIVTNDERMRALPRLEVVRLAELVA